MKLKFLKDCKWCVNHAGVEFKKGEEADVVEAIGNEMIEAGHAEAARLKSAEQEKKEADEKAKMVAEVQKNLEKDAKRAIEDAEKVLKKGEKSKEDEVAKAKSSIDSLVENCNLPELAENEEAGLIKNHAEGLASKLAQRLAELKK